VKSHCTILKQTEIPHTQIAVKYRLVLFTWDIFCKHLRFFLSTSCKNTRINSNCEKSQVEIRTAELSRCERNNVTHTVPNLQR